MPEIPKHIAIILDGNRRYAKKHMKEAAFGHQKGFEKIGEFLKWSRELGIKEVTLYCFSTENFNRDKNEREYLFNLFRNKVKDLKKDKAVHENKIKIRFIGRLSMFPSEIQKEMKEVMELTKNYDGYILNLALAYGSKTELVDAFKQMIRKGVDIDEVNEELIKENLYLSDDVDLLIRPGGEKRMSNFMLWQASYAELWFSDKLWPEFTKEDLAEAVEWHKKRDRRFGR